MLSQHPQPRERRRGNNVTGASTAAMVRGLHALDDLQSL